MTTPKASVGIKISEGMTLHMRWVDDYQRRSLEWIDLGIDYGGHGINATGISIDLREWPHFVEAVKLLDMILKTKGAVPNGTS